MVVLRRESHIALTLLVCGVIVYVMSPDIHWFKKKENQQTQSRKRDIGLSQPERLYQSTDFNKLPSSQLTKASPSLTQPTVDNEPLNTDFSVTEHIEKLNKTKKARNVLVVSDSHGYGLEKVFKKYLPGWKVQVSFFRGYTIEEVQREVKDILFTLGPRDHSFVILHAGTNDFYHYIRPRPLKPEPGQYKEKHSDSYIISSAQTALKALTEHFPNASVIYSANLPRADVPEYPPRKEFVNREIKTKMADIPRTYFIDHSPLFHDSRGQADKRLLMTDLLHMNAAGRDLIVRSLVRTMANIPQQ